MATSDLWYKRDDGLLIASVCVNPRELIDGGVPVINGALEQLRQQFVDKLAEWTRDQREEAAKAFNTSLADLRRAQEKGE